MIVKVIFLTCLVFGKFALGSSDDSARPIEVSEKCDSHGDCQVTTDGATSANETSLLSYFDRRLKLDNAFMELKLEAGLQRMRGEMKRIADCPGFVYGYNCFYLVLDSNAALSVDYFDAKALCRSDGISNLANIYSRTHYLKILRHVFDRKDETPLGFINFWTAMKRDFLSGRVLMSDRTAATYIGNVRSPLEWQTKDSRREYVYVSVWVDGASHDDNPGGYGNVWATFQWNAALCQYPIIASE